MFRFFRTLRLRLLVKNSFSKYALYAIGEIVLVVIGILIALQINTWNEIRKDRKKGKDYVLRLSQELETDQANMQLNLAFYREVFQYGQQVLGYAGKGLQDRQTHWEILVACFQASQIWPLQQGTSTFEELKSAGDFALIQNPETRKDLIYYYGSGVFRYSQTIGITPPYRKMVRGKIPLEVQTYMWDNCHVTQGVIQYMKSCPSPISEEEAGALVRKLISDDVLMDELRFFMSSITAGRATLELQSELCEKILEDLRLSTVNNPE